MGAKSNFLENFMIDGYRRGGAINSSGALNSSAVVKGIWTATTAYVLGDVVFPHANMTGAGGKFMRCTTAGTSGSTNTLAVGNPGSTMTDGGVTWTVVSGLPALMTSYFGLLVVGGQRANSTAYTVSSAAAGYIWLTANDGLTHIYKCTTAGTSAAAQSTLYPGVAGEAITDGTAVFTEQSINMDANSLSGLEVSGGSYARVSYAATLANWAGTQSTGSTTASTGTGGSTSNNNTITFPAPTATWGVVAVLCEFDQATSGNLLSIGALTTPKTVNSGDAAPSYAAGTLQVQEDT